MDKLKCIVYIRYFKSSMNFVGSHNYFVFLLGVSVVKWFRSWTGDPPVQVLFGTPLTLDLGQVVPGSTPLCL